MYPNPNPNPNPNPDPHPNPNPNPTPVCAVTRAERAGLGRSLFERLEGAGHEVVMLTVQYRMHPGKIIRSVFV